MRERKRRMINTRKFYSKRCHSNQTAEKGQRAQTTKTEKMWRSSVCCTSENVSPRQSCCLRPALLPRPPPAVQLRFPRVRACVCGCVRACVSVVRDVQLGRISMFGSVQWD